MQFVVDYSQFILAQLLQPITSPESKVEIFYATIPKYAHRYHFDLIRYSQRRRATGARNPQIFWNLFFDNLKN